MSLLLNLIKDFFTKKQHTSLNCGIFAWIGDDTEKFNPVLFNILGIYNDARGGDSCGVYWNKTALKALGTKAKWEELVRDKEVKLVEKLKLKRYPIIIGHARKASVGTICQENIQPVTLYDSKDKICYVQAHNGTLSNYRELAKKHNINFKESETDSIVLSRLIYLKGFDILEEYEGTAALVINFPKEPNVLYAFHGKSNKYYNVSEERPLHYFHDDAMGTYISSEKSHLQTITGMYGLEPPVEFKHNVLYRLEGNKVEEIRTINRVKETKPTTYNNTIFSYSSGKYDGVNSDFNNNRRDIVPRNICNAHIGHSSSNVSSAVIRYTKGLFWHGQYVAHDYQVVDSWGWTSNKYAASNYNNLYHLWFFGGLLMKNKECFSELEEIRIKHDIEVEEVFKGYDNLRRFEGKLSRCSVFPFTRISDSQTGVMVQSDLMQSTWRTGMFFEGSFTALFSDKILTFKAGDLSDIEKTKWGEVYTIKRLLADYPELASDNFGMLIADRPSFKMSDIDCAMTNPSECSTFGNKNGLCDTCTYNLNYTDNIDQLPFDEDDDKEKVIQLTHILSAKLVPIVHDLEELIEEVDSTGYADCIEDNLNKIKDSKDNLKNIVS